VTQSDPSIFGLISTLILSRFTRFKVFLDIRTPPETVGPRAGFETLSFNVCIRLAKNFFNGITIVTSMLKKEICKKFSIDPSFVGVWSNAASTSFFGSEKSTYYGQELRKKFGLSNKFVVFYHGEFSRNRAIIETVNAISITKGEYPSIVLFLLGNGPIICNLKRIIQEKGIQDSVILHDAVDYLDVPKYIAMSDVGIVPLPNSQYWRYQCPLKLLEYLAMRKAVIVTDIPAIREIIGDKKCGIYTSSTNPEEIASGIIHAYNNKDKLKEWGNAGLEIITKKYNWKKMAQDLDNFLLAKSGEKRECCID